MTKLLQKKFVMTAMIAISFLIFLLLGVINAANIVIVRGDIDRTLLMLSESPMEPKSPKDSMEPKDPGLPPDRSFNPQNRENRLLSSPYFIVAADGKGNIVFTDVSHISVIDEAEAGELAQRAMESGGDAGKIGGYRYRISESPFDMERKIVFLDASNEVYSYLRILFLSAGVGLVCWVFMLLLVILLSRRAIRPIAENMEKQKAFITNAGHEIKTPLAIIQANTDAMELYSGESKWSKNIKQQVARLDGLTKNLLLLTRFDEKGLAANRTIFSLSQVTRETAGSFTEPMALKGIRLEISLQEDVYINADKEQITQLVSILLDNALKYTGENGQAAVFLTREQEHISLQVKNTLSKLPAVSPERLFDRFYRGDAARTQKTGGYGIGLSVAKAICDANHAVISARYELEPAILFEVRF